MAKARKAELKWKRYSGADIRDRHDSLNLGQYELLVWKSRRWARAFEGAIYSNNSMAGRKLVSLPGGGDSIIGPSKTEVCERLLTIFKLIAKQEIIEMARALNSDERAEICRQLSQ